MNCTGCRWDQHRLGHFEVHSGLSLWDTCTEESTLLCLVRTVTGTGEVLWDGAGSLLVEHTTQATVVAQRLCVGESCVGFELTVLHS